MSVEAHGTLWSASDAAAADGCLDFFEWLDLATETAVEGHVDEWSEHVEGDGYDRVHARGCPEHITTPDPHGDRVPASRLTAGRISQGDKRHGGDCDDPQ